MAFGIDGKSQARFGNGAFFANAGQDVGKRPAFRRVIDDVVDCDQRCMNSLAEFGQRAKPARLVATMIMDAGEKGAPGAVCARVDKRSVKFPPSFEARSAGIQDAVNACRWICYLRKAPAAATR